MESSEEPKLVHPILSFLIPAAALFIGLIILAFCLLAVLVADDVGPNFISKLVELEESAELAFVVGLLLLVIMGLARLFVKKSQILSRINLASLILGLSVIIPMGVSFVLFFMP